MLKNYYWRGNIRQLKNITERISALEQDREITAEVLSKYLTPAISSAPAMHQHSGMGGDDYSTERELLYKVLFDMRNDINDLKRMLSDLMRGHSSHPQPQPVHNEVYGLLPSPAMSDGADYAESEEVEEVPHRELTKADVQREQILKESDSSRALPGTKSTPVKKPNSVPVTSKKVGRNDPCPCGSGKKYKKCCGAGQENGDSEE